MSAGDGRLLPLANVRLTYDGGVLTDCEVTINGEVVARLPIHGADLASSAKDIASWRLALHMDHTELVNLPREDRVFEATMRGAARGMSEALAEGADHALKVELALQAKPEALPEGVDPEDLEAPAIATPPPGERRGQPPPPICEGCGHDPLVHAEDGASCTVEGCPCTGWANRRVAGVR